MLTCTLALLDGLGSSEIFVIAIIVLLLFGAKRVPEIGRGLGRAIREFKRATSSVEENIREVLYDEPAPPRLRPPANPRTARTATHPFSTAPASPPPSTPPSIIQREAAPPAGTNPAEPPPQS